MSETGTNEWMTIPPASQHCDLWIFFFIFIIFFFFNDTATTKIYTLSLHDALPISNKEIFKKATYDSLDKQVGGKHYKDMKIQPAEFIRSEEHTSELQSRLHLVCRLLLEKKKHKKKKKNKVNNKYNKTKPAKYYCYLNNFFYTHQL